MRFSNAITALIAASPLALAHPALLSNVEARDIKSIEARANVDYQIVFYLNNQCTGQAFGYRGSGTAPCNAGLGAGAAAYILTTLTPDYIIEPYGDTVCGAGNAFAEIDSDSPKGVCTSLGGNVSSFEVSDAPP